MPAFRDLTGSRYGMWSVMARDEGMHCRVYWICRCDCGTEKAVSGIHLTSGKSTNCGCEKAAKSRARHTTHGCSNTPEHSIWMAMISRCKNPNNTSWASYGGRGIKVCDRWSKFENFIADMGTRPTRRHSIDRIDNDGNYEPSNCRWATQKEQSRNMRKNIRVELGGKTMCLSEACERLGINYDAAKYRVKNGHDWRGV